MDAKLRMWLGLQSLPCPESLPTAVAARTLLPEHKPVNSAATPQPASGTSREICQVVCPANKNKREAWVEPFAIE